MGKAENYVEGYLVKQTKKAGGLCMKWTCPGHNGVPDRIVFIEGEAFLIELKAPGKKPRPLQLKVHAQLLKVGVEVLVMDTREQVDEFFESRGWL